MARLSEHTIHINDIPYTYNTERGIFLRNIEGVAILHRFSKQKNTLSHEGITLSGLSLEVGDIEYVEGGIWIQVTMFNPNKGLL